MGVSWSTPDECEYALHCGGDQPKLGPGRCGLPVGGDERVHPGRIAERRLAHVDDQDGHILAGRRQQRLADLVGVGDIDLVGKMTTPCWPTRRSL